MKKMFCQYILACAVVSVTLLQFASCASDDAIEDSTPGTEEFEEPEEPIFPGENRSRLVKVFERKSWTLDQYIGFMSDVVINQVGEVIPKADMDTLVSNAMILYRQKTDIAFGGRSWHIEQANFNYRSVTTTGDSATFSGCVVYPCADDGGSHLLSGITLYHHHLIVNNSDRPTAVARPVWFRPIYNEALVVSDTQGFGETKEMITPFFDGYSKGRQTVDAGIAALEVLKAQGIKLPKRGYYTENMGASLGALQALGAQRYIESDDCPQWIKDTFKNFRTFSSTGPVETDEVFKAYIDRNDRLVYCDIPMYMMFTVFSSCPDLVEGYKVEDFFDPGVGSFKIRKNGKEMTLIEGMYEKLVGSGDIYSCMSNLYDKHLKKMLAPGMVDSVGNLDMNNEKAKVLMEALGQLNIANNWIPMNTLLLSHSQDDDVLFYEEAKKSYEKLARHNPYVVSFTDSYGNHELSTGIAIVRMTLMQHPSFHYRPAEPIINEIMSLLLNNLGEIL